MNDHKRLYGIYLRVAMLSSVAIFIMLFSFIPYSKPEPYVSNRDIVTIIEKIPLQINKVDQEPPPRKRPSIAANADSGSRENAVLTVPGTNFREIIKTFPTGPDIPIVPYLLVGLKPQSLNKPVPEYPEIAKQAGIEGITHIVMLIDIDGSVIEVKVAKSSGNQLLDQSAITAAWQSRFTPAKQRDRYVRVWVSRTFTFRLTEN